MPGNNLTEALLALTRKQAEALQELATSEGKAAEGAAGLDVKSAEFKETLGKLNELLPGLGDALIAAFDPEAIPLLALSAGIGLLIQQVNAYQKANEEAAEAAIALWQAQKQAVKDAAEDTENYLAALARIKAARDGLQAGEELEMVRLKARAEEHQKILEFEEKRALLAAQGDLAREAHIRNLFEGKKSDAALADERAELGQLQQDLEQARFSEGFARRNFNAAHAAVISGPSPEAIKARSEAQSWLQQHAGDLETAEANAAKMSVADAEQNVKEAENSESGDPEGKLAALAGAQIMLAMARQAEAELKRVKQETDEHQAIVDQYDAAQKARLKAEQDAADALNRQAGAVDKFTKQYNEAAAIYDIHNETAVHTGQRAGPDARLPVPTAQPVIPPRQTSVAQAWRDMEQLRAALERLNTGGDPINDKQTTFLQEAVALIEGHYVRVDKLREELGKIFARQSSVNDAYDRLLQYLQSQQQNAGNRSLSQ